jgi:murein DD-endopeptidase MepM/ murein hydrolase activator NlpD
MKINFRLPFDDFWLTFWGGDTLKQNHHHDSTSQQYAFDFIQTDKEGKFFRTNGKTNADYFSFGADIIAPADGVVVEVVSGLRDNNPGELNSFNFIGNYVLIRHAPKVFSVLGHLRQNSVVVSVGKKVKSGHKLGECGNSGYSTDPHLHFHVQNSDVFAKMDKNYKKIDVAKGQKVFFDRVTLLNDENQRVMSGYSPVKGDVVSHGR